MEGIQPIVQDSQLRQFVEIQIVGDVGEESSALRGILRDEGANEEVVGDEVPSKTWVNHRFLVHQDVLYIQPMGHKRPDNTQHEGFHEEEYHGEELLEVVAHVVLFHEELPREGFGPDEEELVAVQNSVLDEVVETCFVEQCSCSFQGPKNSMI